MPLGGLSFGASVNAWGTIPMADQFAYYNSGGLDITFLGLAQVDAKGNINVSKFGDKVTGAGGSINISQNTHKVVYCGTFTAGGLKLSVEEGRNKKFVKAVEQVTFSSKFAKDTGQEVLYVTERAVFRLEDEALVLIEIAPGVRLQEDILDQMDFEPIVSAHLKEMDAKLFMQKLMGLKEMIGV